MKSLIKTEEVKEFEYSETESSTKELLEAKLDKLEVELKIIDKAYG